ncbi:hypothetical protein C8R44DRAFT_744057 [Mycena epipterygia]|nr:hypothetical protein C8R44DRAFT_744057 [Mycena epipterygia]
MYDTLAPDRHIAEQVDEGQDIAFKSCGARFQNIRTVAMVDVQFWERHVELSDTVEGLIEWGEMYATVNDTQVVATSYKLCPYKTRHTIDGLLPRSGRTRIAMRTQWPQAQKLTYARGTEHRKVALSKPDYVAPPRIYESGQPRISAPSSEVDSDSDDEMEDAEEAGPSGTRDNESEEVDIAWDAPSPEYSFSEPGHDNDLGGEEEASWTFDWVIMRRHWDGRENEQGTESESEEALDDDEVDSEAGIAGEDSDGDDSDTEPDLFDWDSFKAPGLSAYDQLGEEFEREAATAHKLRAYDLAICRAFAFKVRTNLTDRGFKMAPFAFPQEPPLPSLDGIRSRVNVLTGFKPQIYDCCVNSCLCFVGPHKDLTACSYCHEPRLHANGKPRKKFTYIPIILRLVAFAGNREMAEKCEYRSKHVHMPGTTTDVFDGKHYRCLRKKNVEINGETFKHKYFKDV